MTSLTTDELRNILRNLFSDDAEGIEAAQDHISDIQVDLLREVIALREQIEAQKGGAK